MHRAVLGALRVRIILTQQLHGVERGRDEINGVHFEGLPDQAEVLDGRDAQLQQSLYMICRTPYSAILRKADTTFSVLASTTNKNCLTSLRSARKLMNICLRRCLQIAFNENVLLDCYYYIII